MNECAHLTRFVTYDIIEWVTMGATPLSALRSSPLLNIKTTLKIYNSLDWRRCEYETIFPAATRTDPDLSSQRGRGFVFVSILAVDPGRDRRDGTRLSAGPSARPCFPWDVPRLWRSAGWEQGLYYPGKGGDRAEQRRTMTKKCRLSPAVTWIANPSYFSTRYKH